MTAKHDYQNWLDRQAKTPGAEEAFMAGHKAGAEGLRTAQAQLQLAIERMTAFCDAVAPASDITEALRNAGLGRVWDGLMDAVRRLPLRSECTIWEVEHQKEGCAACPAGRDYALCLVSLEDIEASTLPGVPAPADCPLRNGGSVLLVGEP